MSGVHLGCSFGSWLFVCELFPESGDIVLGSREQWSIEIGGCNIDMNFRACARRKG